MTAVPYRIVQRDGGIDVLFEFGDGPQSWLTTGLESWTIPELQLPVSAFRGQAIKGLRIEVIPVDLRPARITDLGAQFENMRWIDWGKICGYQGSCRAAPGHEGYLEGRGHVFSGDFPIRDKPL